MDGGAGAELDWVMARDAAVLLLLYGSGLRISEALGLLRKDAPLDGRDVLRITGKGGKDAPRAGAARDAGGRGASHLDLCPYALPLRAAVPRRQGRSASARASSSC